MAFRFSRLLAVQCVGLAAVAAVTPAVASRSHRVAFVRHLKFASHVHHKAVPAHVIHVLQGQRGIDAERTRAIQTALIDRNYLTGEPTGEWDATTEAAMQRFQGDNGWQTKLMPDSRALIKLGLGPIAPNAVAGSSEAAAPKAALEQATGPDTLAAVHSILN